MFPLRARLAGWYFLALGSLGALHPFFAPALQRAGADPALIPLILGVFPLVRLTAGPVWGWLTDRSGRPELVLRVASAAAALCAILLWVAPDWRWMALATAALALCRVPIFPLADVLVVRSQGSYGPIRLWGSIGFITAALLVSPIADADARAPMLVTAILLAGTAGVSTTLPREGPATREPLLPALGRLLRLPSLRPLWLLSALHAATLSTYDHLFSLHVEGLGLSMRVTGFAFAAGVAAEVGILAGGAFLVARFGAARLILLGVLSGVPRWLLTGTMEDPVVLVAAQTLHGLGYGAWWIGSVALLARRAPDDLRNSAQSLFTAAAYGVGALLAMVGGAVALRFWDPKTLFLSLSVLSLLAVVATLPLLRPVRPT